MLAKSLVKSMTRDEAIDYCRKHPPWRIPTGVEAEALRGEDIDWNVFRVAEEISGRNILYYKKEQHYRITHPVFKHHVILVKEKT